MTTAQILALPTQANTRLLKSSDDGLFYSIEAGESGANAIPLLGGDGNNKLPVLNLPDVVAFKGGEGVNFFVVDVSSGLSTTNGANLLAAYEAAKSLNPNGQALSDTNRAAVLLPPAKYDLSALILTLNQDFIDIVGISGAREDVIITSSSASGTVQQVCNNSRIENVTFDNTNVAPLTYIPQNNSAVLGACSVYAISMFSMGITKAGHGLVAGDQVLLSSTNNASYTGTLFTVTSVVSADVFAVAANTTVLATGVNILGVYRAKIILKNVHFLKNWANGDCGLTGVECLIGSLVNGMAGVVYGNGFGYNALGGSVCLGNYTDCIIGQGFGSTAPTGGNVITRCGGTFLRCRASNGGFAFSSSNPIFHTTAEAHIFGTYTDCVGTFGVGAAVAGRVSSPTLIRCSGGDVALNTVFTGRAMDCDAVSFGLNSMTGTLVNCRASGASLPTVTGNGRIRQCYINATTGGTWTLVNSGGTL